jgi:hypothetical protein
MFLFLSPPSPSIQSGLGILTRGFTQQSVLSSTSSST